MDLPVWFWPVVINGSIYILMAGVGALIGGTWFMLTLHDLLKKLNLYDEFEKRLAVYRDEGSKK